MDRRALAPSYESFTRSDTEPTNYLSVLALGTSSCGVVESSEANEANNKGDRDDSREVDGFASSAESGISGVGVNHQRVTRRKDCMHMLYEHDLWQVPDSDGCVDFSKQRRSCESSMQVLDKEPPVGWKQFPRIPTIPVLARSSALPARGRSPLDSRHLRHPTPRPQPMPRPESPSLGRAPTPPVPADTPAVARLRDLLGRTVKIGIQDSRIFLGTFACTDKALNVVLANTYEYRPSEAADDGNPPGRYVGMVMIPWKYVRNVELQMDFGEWEGDYT